MKKFILFFNIFLFVGCSNNQHPKTSQVFEEQKDSLHKVVAVKIPSPQKPHLDTAFMKWINSVNIILPYGFEIKGCSIKKNGVTIYKDSIDPVYYNKNDLYPIIRDLGNNCFELLLQYANAPNMDLAQHFIIKNDKVIKLDTLPSFATHLSNLKSDSLIEYAGLWDCRQTCGTEEWDSACYEPILFFKARKNGIMLDSNLTIKTNKRIYGKFYGFFINEKIGFDNYKIKPILDKAIDSLKMKFK